MAGIGRYGPYLQTDGRYIKLEGTQEALTIGLNHAVTKIAEAPQRGGRRGATPLKELGAHPEDGAMVAVMEGRYGPYVKHNRLNATLPKDVGPDDVTMEQAIALLQARAEKAGTKKPRKAATKKPAAKKKTAAKKTTAKKATTKKAPARKAKTKSDSKATADS